MTLFEKIAAYKIRAILLYCFKMKKRQLSQTSMFDKPDYIGKKQIFTSNFMQRLLLNTNIFSRFISPTKKLRLFLTQHFLTKDSTKSLVHLCFTVQCRVKKASFRSLAVSVKKPFLVM